MNPGIIPSPLLQKSYVVPGTSIEIVRAFDGRQIETVLFDFDGTLSLERDGWPNLMVATNSSALVQAVPAMGVAEAVEWVIRDIETTIGIPTYMQMKRLCEEITRRGGYAASPKRYKDVYNDALVAMVESVHRALADGRIRREEVVVRGADDLLRALAEWVRPDALYLASGTDIAPILASVRLLEMEEYFTGRIIAAGSTGDPEQCAKQLVIEKLVREKNLKPGQLLCFGDGSPEITRAAEAGGVAVGVLTPDHSHYELQGHFTVEQKRQRLIRAGAHILVPDFRDAGQLIQAIQKGHA